MKIIKPMKKPERLPFRTHRQKMEWAMKMLGETDVLNLIMNWGNDKIYFKDRQSRFFFISKGQAKNFGYRDVEKIVGTSDFDFFAPEHAIQAFRDEKRILRTGKPLVGMIEKETWPDGRFSWVSTSKYPLRDRKGRIIGTWGISRDVTDLKATENELARLNLELNQANEKLGRISKTDTLTGLLNRRTLYETLKRHYKLRGRARDKGCKAEFSVVLLDVDRFKNINDAFGHLAGDRAISHMARILLKGIRETDSLFRYGGDEFLLLLPGTGLSDARFVARKLLKNIRSIPCRFEGKTMRLTASAGVACSSETAGVNSLLKSADKRLYASKKAGRDRAS